MAASVYVYGPAGCGKSSSSIRLKRKFGLDQIIDDYDCFGPNRTSVPKQGALVIGQGKHNGPPGVRAVSYAEAIK